VQAYLVEEYAAYPPFTMNRSNYFEGANRAPYEVPWDKIGSGVNAAFQREERIRTMGYFGDLYGIDAYERVAGPVPDPESVRLRAQTMSEELLRTQDWAIGGPVAPRPKGGTFFRAGYYDRNGAPNYNSAIAGAIGLARMARRHGWKAEEDRAYYLFGKLALARIGMARYTAELHRMGIVEGDERDDWRTLVHLDPTCAIVLRGPVASIVREDQEIPPFIGLVEELGTLLGRHAREECQIYLDHLDRSMPLWYLSEAPKQSGSEQRLCPLLHKSGNVLAQSWILGKRGEAYRRYVDTTRFKGDLYYIENMAAAIRAYAQE
jgi:hypothetical protein